MDGKELNLFCIQTSACHSYQESITPRVNVALAQEIVVVDRCKYYVLNIVNVVIIVNTIHDHEYKL